MTDQSTLEQEIAVEQRHLDRVYARLAELRRSAAAPSGTATGMARVGNFGALVERDAMVFHAAQRRHVLDAEHEGLVFGRLDLRDRSGAARRAARRAGRGRRAAGGRLAGAGRGRLLPGDPGASRCGVVRRRTIQSRGERVTRIEDDLLDPDGRAGRSMAVVGDGALLATLSRATGRGMRDIVATIQREQDEAIRSPGSGVTIVSGGPGTGKTAVALHRAAYLLYSDRARFAGGGDAGGRPVRRSSSSTSPRCCPRWARRRPRCTRSARSSPA